MRTPRRLAALGLLMFVVGAAGCAATQKDAIRVSEIEGNIERVVDRHNSYVDRALAEGLITAAQHETYRHESKVLLEAVTEDPDGVLFALALRDLMLPVLDRHDAYVRADVSLDEDHRNGHLLTTRILRRIGGVDTKE